MTEKSRRSPGQGNILNKSPAYTQSASKGAERHCNAGDEQDIPPEKAPSGCEATGHRKRGRKRGRKRKNWMPNPFGKYSTSSALKKYIEATIHYYAPSTQAERQRKLRYICNKLKSLSTAKSPKSTKDTDIIAFIDWMKTKGLDNRTQRKYIKYLQDYLAFYNNDVLSKMLSKRQIRLPGNIPKEIRSLSMETVETIHKATKLMDSWPGSVARFITLFYPYTGLRPSELRTLRLKDVDMQSWTLIVSHPKGEGQYGMNRRVGIPSIIRLAVTQYISERKAFLQEHGYSEDVEPLIPYEGKKGLSFWPHQQLLRLKREIERLSGTSFKLKDYRATYCQFLIDSGADLPSVSKVMGHKTTTTTESYYGRIRDDDAIEEINRVFSEPYTRH